MRHTSNESHPPRPRRGAEANGYVRFLLETVRLETSLWTRLDDLQRASGSASVAQWYALRAVQAGRGAARVHDVAHELQITVGAASKLVDRLERDGLAARSSNPDDRRSMLIALTTEGARVLDDATEAATRSISGLLGPALSEDRAMVLATQLSDISSILQKSDVS